MLQVKNILVPIDFSTNSGGIFELGHCMAQHTHARLHLIHIIDPIYYEKQQSEVTDLDFIHKMRLENAKEELKKFKIELPFSDIDIIEVLLEGIPHKEILKYAKQNEIDMIIIASHGWTNVTRNVMGNIADKIMKQSDIPVICLKSNVLMIKSRPLKKQIFSESLIG